MREIIFRYTVCGMLKCCTITTDQLMDAIAEVESGRGATSANVYQLRPIFVEDVCRISGQRFTFGQVVGCDELARCCIENYWEHYGARYNRMTDRSADASVLARIHNGGPDGWRKPATVPYWRRVRNALVASLRKGGRK